MGVLLSDVACACVLRWQMPDALCRVKVRETGHRDRLGCLSTLPAGALTARYRNDVAALVEHPLRCSAVQLVVRGVEGGLRRVEDGLTDVLGHGPPLRDQRSLVDVVRVGVEQ